MVSRGSGQRAPSDLERVRTLLNTWLIPNDTRVATDRFDAYARRLELPVPEARSLRALRDDLRAAVEAHASGDQRLTRWIVRLKVRPAIHSGTLVFEHTPGAAGDLIAIVLHSIVTGGWTRLKACPDCRWVFYDHTRNGSKRWCLMYAGGPRGRACGTIAKVRRHRERQRAEL